MPSSCLVSWRFLSARIWRTGWRIQTVLFSGCYQHGYIQVCAVLAKPFDLTSAGMQHPGGRELGSSPIHVYRMSGPYALEDIAICSCGAIQRPTECVGTRVAQTYPSALSSDLASAMGMRMGLCSKQLKLRIASCAKCNERVGEASHPGPQRPAPAAASLFS